MVHKHRSSAKSGTVMDVNTVRQTLTTAPNKSELSSSPRIGYKLEVPSRSTDNTTSKWYYNDMISNNRQEFNNLHFC